MTLRGDLKALHGDLSGTISGIAFDSRKVKPGNLFVAVKGLLSDGHDYISTAIQKGATAIVCEVLPEERSSEVCYVQVDNSAKALALMAAEFYGHPSKDLKLVGITGTNGKTTTATLLYKLFTQLGYKAGLISTVENKIGNDILPADFTTPDAVAINELLLKMIDAGCEYVFMEVSSHAVDQERIAGLNFTGAVFTNLTHDHLDYHKTFKAYLEAKKRFFDQLPANSFSLTNVDDRNGKVMLQNTKSRKFSYGLKRQADFKAKIIENSFSGLHLIINGTETICRLIGEFNAYNLMAVYGTALLLDSNEEEVLTALSNLTTAEGRFDYQISSEGIIAIVDYAHTPDALEKVLTTIAHLRKGTEKVITVVGCGGDRDKAKRPKMARIACENSQQVILTSDNPRTEDADTIIEEMEVGVPPHLKNKVLSITNRKQAIKTAARLATKGDIILVAGKGHEKYQDINGVKEPFDDKEVLRELLTINY
ncbi:MAG: UDP-N-acetylmuramoyl-L-alanyl-D-glutamate--2,6-diaminopimelate ligase [Saprospiraceae bacterium]